MCEKIIPPEMVRRLAQASRISLTEEEMERFAGQLSGVLEAFKALDALEVEGVEPSYHPVPLEEDQREDVEETWDWDPLANVGFSDKRFIRGPRVR